MMTKRYLGNIITQNPTAPANNYEDTSAPGVWSLAEAFAYSKAGLWPTAGNLGPTAVFAGGRSSGTETNTIDYMSINSTGNASDWGDLTLARLGLAGCGNAVRSVFSGGDGGGATNVMDYITYSSQGNAVDFGDTSGTDASYNWSAASNETRGVITRTDDIYYITIASTGNTASFGNWGENRGDGAMSANSTRALIFAGVGGQQTTDYVTIATTGSAASFGNCSGLIGRASSAASDTRAILFSGRATNGSSRNQIEYVTIASTGNTIDFGDVNTATQDLAGASSNIYALKAGGVTNLNVIEYVTIATIGNAVDFGDLTVGRQDLTGTSNAHGGLAA